MPSKAQGLRAMEAISTTFFTLYPAPSQEKTTLKMYLHSMMLSSAQLHAIELALTAAVQAIVHHVNSRLLLDEVGRYVAAWRLWNRPPDNDPRRDCCVGGVTAPCNTRV